MADMQSLKPQLAQVQQLQQILAPQLRQSLEMLQVPVMELQAMLRKELETNPTVEEVPSDRGVLIDDADPDSEVPTVRSEQPPSISDDEADGNAAPAKEADELKPLDFDREFEAIAELDREWRDYFFQDAQSRSYTEEDAERRQFLLDSLPQRKSLQDHLLEQLNESTLSEADRQLGELLIGNINESGYLTVPLEELAQTTGTDLQHLQDILTLVQDFHPTGVGARDLKECLLIQLERSGRKDPVAEAIIREHLDKLAERKHEEIAKALKVPVEEVNVAARFISTLNPAPGQAISDELPSYVVPEVIVEKVDGRYVVMLDDDQLPHIRISNHYRSLLNDPNTSPETKSYIREKIRAGVFLIKSLHQRQKTIYRIASEIVEAQQAFFENGVSALKPLTMAEVARRVGVHETTVSRAVAGKYMKTPIGVFEMKFFFTPGVRTTDGRQVSNKTVKDMIANLVGNEDVDRPLSDQEIVAKLAEQGIQVARRTVAKYRLMLKIPPSHIRKRM